MRTSDYIEAVKKELGADSYRAVAKTLEIHETNITFYRANTKQFSPETAKKIAEILRIPGTQVAADMLAQRAKTKETRKYWAGLGTTAAIVLAITTGATPSAIPQDHTGITGYTLCAMFMTFWTAYLIGVITRHRATA